MKNWGLVRGLVGVSAWAWVALPACAAAADEVPVIQLPPEPAAASSYEREGAVLLEPVVVTGTRTEQPLADSPVEVQLVSRRTIRNSGARDLAELLEREGGIHVSRSAGRGSSIEIQGMTGEQVLILVDGRRMIGRIDGNIDLARLHLDSIERVEIVKGPSSALYGADALGGVVNIITRGGGREQGGSLSLRGDSEANADAFGNAGFTLGSLRGQLGGGYSHLEPYDLDERTPGEDGVEGDSGFWTANGEWRPGERFGLGLYGAYALDDTQRVDTGTSSSQAFDTHKRIEEVRTGIAPQWQLGDASQLRLDLYYNRYFDQFLTQQRGDATGENTIDEETVDELFSGGGQLDHRIGAHALSVGGEYSFERLDADRLSEAGERDRQSLYGQDQWSLGRLTLVPGLRYDRDSQFGNQLSPKLALRYDLDAAWFLRAGYGRGYRAPDFKEMLLRFDNPAVGYQVVGNPQLEAERSSGYNLGLTWQAHEQASVALSVYHNDVSDLIEIIPIQTEPNIVYSYRNVAEASLSGLDLQTRWQPWQPLELQLGYGWLRSRDESTGEELSGRAEHRANLALRFEQPAYALQLRGVWVGERRFLAVLGEPGDAPEPGDADAYALLDARAEWTALAPFTVALGCDNLLDEGDARYLPIAPRAGYLELRWNWQ